MGGVRFRVCRVANARSSRFCFVVGVGLGFVCCFVGLKYGCCYGSRSGVGWVESGGKMSGC